MFGGQRTQPHPTLLYIWIDTTLFHMAFTSVFDGGTVYPIMVLSFAPWKFGKAKDVHPTSVSVFLFLFKSYLAVELADLLQANTIITVEPYFLWDAVKNK